MRLREIKSVDEAKFYNAELSLNEAGYRFRGHSDTSWKLLPSVYRYKNFERYQTTFYESFVLHHKFREPINHLMTTNYDLEWLMLCQHFQVPTRLLDWSDDILIALFFACSDDMCKNGAVFVCNKNEYPLFHDYNQTSMTNDLAFIDTTLKNPRMRNQNGCFMMWGHVRAPIAFETYNLQEYHTTKSKSFFLDKLIIPSHSKGNILRELDEIYSISKDSIYLESTKLVETYTPLFRLIKEKSRLMTLMVSDSAKLSPYEFLVAKSHFRVILTDMFKGAKGIVADHTFEYVIRDF